VLVSNKSEGVVKGLAAKVRFYRSQGRNCVLDARLSCGGRKRDETDFSVWPELLNDSFS